MSHDISHIASGFNALANGQETTEAAPPPPPAPARCDLLRPPAAVGSKAFFLERDSTLLVCLSLCLLQEESGNHVLHRTFQGIHHYKYCCILEVGLYKGEQRERGVGGEVRGGAGGSAGGAG